MSESITFNPDSPNSGADYSIGSGPGNVSLSNVGIVLNPTSSNQVEVWVSFSHGLDKLHLVFDPSSVKTLDGFTPEAIWDGRENLENSLEPYALTFHTGAQGYPADQVYAPLPGEINTWINVGTLSFTLQSGETEIALVTDGDLAYPDPTLGYYNTTYASTYQGYSDNWSAAPDAVAWHWVNTSDTGEYAVAWSVGMEHSLTVQDGIEIGSYGGGQSLEAIFLNITPGSGIGTVDVAWSTTDMADGSDPTYLYNVNTPSATSASTHSTGGATDVFTVRLPFSASWLPNDGDVTYYWRVKPKDQSGNNLTPQYGSLSISDFDNKKAPAITLSDYVLLKFDDVFNPFAASHYGGWRDSTGAVGSVADVTLEPSVASLPDTTSHTFVHYYVRDPETGHGAVKRTRVNRGYAPTYSVDAVPDSSGIMVSVILGDSFGPGVAYAPDYALHGQTYQASYPSRLFIYRSQNNGGTWDLVYAPHLPQSSDLGSPSPEVVVYDDNTADFGINYWYKAVVQPTDGATDENSSQHGEQYRLLGSDSYEDGGQISAAIRQAVDYSLFGNAEEGSGGTTIDFTANPGADIDHLHFEIVRDDTETKSQMVYPDSPGSSTEYSFLLSDFDLPHGSFDWTIRGVDSSHNDVATPVTGTVTITYSAPADTTPPTITLLVNGNDVPGGDATVTLPYGTPFDDSTYGGYTANDDVDGDITNNVTLGGDYVDYDTPGTYHVTYTVSDSAGNTTTVTRDVIIQEEQALDTNLEVISITDTDRVPSVTIAWGADVDSYEFQMVHNSNGMSWSPSNSPHSSGDTSPTTHTAPWAMSEGLYTWTLSGQDSQGNSLEVSTGTHTIAPTIDIETVAVTADARPWDSGNVRWSLTPGLVAPSGATVSIQRRKTVADPYVTIASGIDATTGGLDGDAGTGYYDHPLEPDTTYYYTLRLFDASGNPLGLWSTVLEYATVAEPELTSVDVDTRGIAHPVVAITGQNVPHWYWTTETVDNPQDRTKADWDADPNAYYVNNTSGGVLSAVMSHKGPGAGVPSGDHASGSYSVTVCGFWGDGFPILETPSSTVNTVHVVPYQVFSGLVNLAIVGDGYQSDQTFKVSATKPNGELDFHRVWYGANLSLVASSPGVIPRGTDILTTSYSNYVESTAGDLVFDYSGVSSDFGFVHVVPTSDENNESITETVYKYTIPLPKGLSSMSAVVTGDNLSSGDNITFTVYRAGSMISPGGLIRISDTPPPTGATGTGLQVGGVSGPVNLSDWGVRINVGNEASATFDLSDKEPGTKTYYAVAVYDDDTPIGSPVSTMATVDQHPFTGLTDLTFSLSDSGSVELQAYGYFPQWRYYVGVLPYRTEAGSDMNSDPNGTAVTEYVETPNTEPSRVSIDIEPNRKTVVIGVATDGQYLLGKPLIRVIHFGTRTPAEENLIRTSLAPDTFDHTHFAVAGVFGSELDEDGNRKKIVLTSSSDTVSKTLVGWVNQGLSTADVVNLMIKPNGDIRPLEKITPYVPPVVGRQTTTFTDNNGTERIGIAKVYTPWSATDGTLHMGVDFSAELQSDFAGVDNALVTLITNDNGIETMADIIAATGEINLTSDPNGTLTWPDAFVKERVKEVRDSALISKDAADQLLLGTGFYKPTRKDEQGNNVHTKVKRTDPKFLYPNANFTDPHARTNKYAEKLGVSRIAPQLEYQGGYMIPKVRSGSLGKVAADAFFKQPDRFGVALNVVPPTTSTYEQSAAINTDYVLDLINDRPDGPLSPSSSLSTPAGNPLTEQSTYNAGLLAGSATLVGSPIELNTLFQQDLAPGLFEIQVDRPGNPPEVPLFTTWADRSDEDVPLEVLNRYLEFGNAPTQETLQRVYDLEKVVDPTVVGSGRDRTEWTQAIVTYATNIGISITE